MGRYTEAGTYIGHHTATLGLLCLQIRQAVFDSSTGDLLRVLCNVYLLYFFPYIRYVGARACGKRPLP